MMMSTNDTVMDDCEGDKRGNSICNKGRSKVSITFFTRVFVSVNQKTAIQIAKTCFIFTDMFIFSPKRVREFWHLNPWLLIGSRKIRVKNVIVFRSDTLELTMHMHISSTSSIERVSFYLLCTTIFVKTRSSIVQ